MRQQDFILITTCKLVSAADMNSPRHFILYWAGLASQKQAEQVVEICPSLKPWWTAYT